MSENLILEIIKTAGAIISPLLIIWISKKINTKVDNIHTKVDENTEITKVVQTKVAIVEKHTNGLVEKLVKKEGELGEAKGELKVREEIRIENGGREVCVYVLEDNEYDIGNMERMLKEMEDVTKYKLFYNTDDLKKELPSEVNLYIIDDNLGQGRTGVEAVNEIFTANGNNFLILCSGSDDEVILKKYDNIGVDRTLYKNDAEYPSLFKKYVADGLRFAALRK